VQTTLFTFPPSLDCELDRFLLGHYQVPYTEQRHALIFSPFVTLWNGATPLFPLLLGDGYNLSKSRQVIDHFDPLAPSELRLLPSRGGERDAVEADWAEFNQTLAFATATFAYYHLLLEPKIMMGPLAAGAPSYEQASVRTCYPFYAGILSILLRLTSERAAEALQRIQLIADKVDARLQGGRRFLVGERLSLSDMAFAVALAPLTLPNEYGGALPAEAEMPEPVLKAIHAMRERASGRFALRIYRDFRRAASLEPAAAA